MKPLMDAILDVVRKWELKIIESEDFQSSLVMTLTNPTFRDGKVAADLSITLYNASPIIVSQVIKQSSPDPSQVPESTASQ